MIPRFADRQVAVVFRGRITGVLPYVYRVTKYDPADRDEQGRYVGVEDSVSDHGPVEAAYLEAVAAFASDAGVQRLSIREPGLSGINFGLEPAVPGHGLNGLFLEGLSGFTMARKSSSRSGLSWCGRC